MTLAQIEADLNQAELITRIAGARDRIFVGCYFANSPATHQERDVTQKMSFLARAAAAPRRNAQRAARNVPTNQPGNHFLVLSRDRRCLLSKKLLVDARELSTLILRFVTSGSDLRVPPAELPIGSTPILAPMRRPCAMSAFGQKSAEAASCDSSLRWRGTAANLQLV
jgi:hypothetical protein